MKLGTVGNSMSEVCFSHIQGFMVSIYLINGFINLDHLVMVESAGFLYYKVTIFPFVLISLNLCKSCSSLNIYLLVLESIDGFCQ